MPFSFVNIKNSLFKPEGTKKIIVILLACAFTACLLTASSILLMKSFSDAKSEEPSPEADLSASQKQMQTQIGDLSKKVAEVNNLVSQLQSRVNTPAVSPTSAPVQPVATEFASVKENLNKLTNTVDSMQTQLKTLEESAKANSTIIGTTSVIVNGLSITFISNNIYVASTGTSPPGVAQFAIKISNLTASALSNLDITGTISSTQSFRDMMAGGYPQLSDANALCSYFFFIGPTNILNFEAYGAAKTSLSIPAKGSVILRPKLSVLAASGNRLPASIYTIALNTITFDGGATK